MREMGRKKKSLMVDAAQKISPATDHSKIINIEDVNCYLGKGGNKLRYAISFRF